MYLIDGELDGQPNSTALGDGQDEDGVAIFPSLGLSPNTIFRLPLTVMNTTGDTAYVEAWGTREQFWNANVEGTRQIVEMAKKSGVKISIVTVGRLCLILVTQAAK